MEPFNGAVTDRLDCLAETNIDIAESPEFPARLMVIMNISAVVIATVLFLCFCFLSTKPVPWPDDSFSDMNAMMSGRNFAEHGFVRLRFLPMHYTGGVGPEPRYYLHYPPLSDILNGVWRILGVHTISGWRMISGLASAIGLYLMYRAFALVIGRLAGVCSLAFMCTTHFTLSYGMSVHAHAYNFLLLGTFFWMFLRAVETDRPRRWPWVVCWLTLLLGAMNSFEFILYPHAFAWVYLIVTKRFRRHWLALVLLAAAPVVGVGLHFAQNIWAIGWQAAWADRLGFGHYHEWNRRMGWAQLPDLLTGRSTMMLFWPWYVLPVLGLVCLVYVHRVRPPGITFNRAAAAFWATLAAGITWYLALPSHTVPHRHTINQLLPAFGLVIGGAGAIAVAMLVARKTPVTLRVCAALGLLVIAYGQYSGIKSRLARKGTLPTSAMAEAIGGDVLPENAAVAFSTAAEAHFAYFVDRPAWRCPKVGLPFPESLPQLVKATPPGYELKYYVFFAPPSEETIDAYRLLAANCPGKMALVPYLHSPKRAIILFDISELLKPPEQRNALAPDLADQQLRGGYPIWDIPDLEGRIRRAYENQTGIPFEVLRGDRAGS